MQSAIQRWRPLAPYFGAFLGLGVALSFVGPALPELRRQTGSTIGEMGWVFSAQSVGGLLGSVVAGRVFRRFGGRHLMAVSLGAFAVAILAVPGAGELGFIVLAGAVIGFGAGSVDVGGNTLVSGLVSPDRLVSSINALHMSFAVGAVIAPLVVGISLSGTGSLWPACATFAVGTGAVACVLWFGDRAGSARQAADDHAQRGAAPENWRLAMVALFFVLYVGLEIGFAGWIATYSDELGLGSGWATGLTVAFWAGFLLGRVGMVWRGDRIPTGRILAWSVGVATLLAIGVAAAGSHPVPLLVVSVLFGAVIAPQFPTMLAHLHHVVPLSGVVTAWCIAGSALGGLLLPPLIGALLDSVGTGALPWTIAASSAASGVVVFAIDRWALAIPAATTSSTTPPDSIVNAAGNPMAVPSPDA
ncbi:MAG: MFS transporter [Acidimicrobiia bacterium]